MNTRYPFEKITEALILLRNNNFNYNKTFNQCKIPADTIRRWKKKYGKGIYDAETIPAPDPVKLKKAEIITEQKEVRVEMNELCNLIIKIAKQKLKDEDFIKKITPKDLGILIKETLPFIIPKFEEDGKGVKNYNTVFNNFVENTYNQLIQSGHEQRNTPIERTPKKLPGRDE